MKFLFIVQGEGRGHMTQAISFAKMLQNQGHELAGVILGKSNRRDVPEFFRREIAAPVHLVESPNFACDKAEKAVLIGKTIRQNFSKLPTFWKSLQKIHTIATSEKPDVILNFYDLLGGLYHAIYRPKNAFWAIGHQYLMFHPEFKFAPSTGINKFLFKFNTKLTAIGASEILALSFYELENTAKITVVPPLLREQVKDITPSNGNFYLTYMVNSGLGEEVIAFAKANPSLEICAYWDKRDAEEISQPLPNLRLCKVHDQHFLQDMAACKGLVSTAGFESICEAMYLKKPIMMIPVPGQYEQACNALDAVSSGSVLVSNSFDFGLFDQAILSLKISNNLRSWESQWEKINASLLKEVSSATTTEPSFSGHPLLQVHQIDKELLEEIKS